MSIPKLGLIALVLGMLTGCVTTQVHDGCSFQIVSTHCAVDPATNKHDCSITSAGFDTLTDETAQEILANNRLRDSLKCPKAK